MLALTGHPYLLGEARVEVCVAHQHIVSLEQHKQQVVSKTVDHFLQQLIIILH